MLNQTEKNMKKSVLALAMAFGVTTAFAQDLTSKKGEPILPEAGDWGLSVDASPFLQYAKGFIGNFNAGGQTISWNSLTTPVTISGKMFTDEKTAYRGTVTLGTSSKKYSAFVTDNTSTATPPATKEDTYKKGGPAVWLAGGIEMRRGKTRLQGYYGGEFGIGFGSTKETYTYGNAFSATVTNPNTTDWSAWGGASNGGGSRTLSTKSGSTISLGLRGFIGAEYFVLAKMSIGGEFGFGLGLTTTGEGETVTESLNTAGTGGQSTTTKTGKSSSMDFGANDNFNVFGGSGSVKLNLYF